MRFPMRVAFLLPTLGTGGLERMVTSLATGLDRSAFHPQVELFDALGPLEAIFTRAGIPVRLDRRRRGYLDPLLIRRLARRWRREGVGVVHAHNTTAMVYASLAGRLAGIPVVYTEHGPSGRRFPHPMHDRLLHKLAARFVRRAAVVARWLGDALVKWEGFPPEQVVFVPNGIDPAPFREPLGERSAVRASLGIPFAGPVAGCVARLDPVKNHRLLLRAWRTVVALHPQATLLLAGDGPEREPLRRLADSLGLSGRVRFLGDRSDVPRLLRAMDFHVLASRSEGTSLTLLEAMAASRASIATAVGGTPDVIEHGRTGWLVPPGDGAALATAILALCAEPGRALAMGLAASEEFDRRFTLDSMVRRYESIYRECAAARGAVFEHV